MSCAVVPYRTVLYEVHDRVGGDKSDVKHSHIKNIKQIKNYNNTL
jgi:hypothetical protein